MRPWLIKTCDGFLKLLEHRQSPSSTSAQEAFTLFREAFGETTAFGGNHPERIAVASNYNFKGCAAYELGNYDVSIQWYRR